MEVTLEGKVAYLKVDCPQTTVFGVLQATIALEINVAFAFDIDFELQFETDTKWNSGPCELTDGTPF